MFNDVVFRMFYKSIVSQLVPQIISVLDEKILSLQALRYKKSIVWKVVRSYTENVIGRTPFELAITHVSYGMRLKQDYHRRYAHTISEKAIPPIILY